MEITKAYLNFEEVKSKGLGSFFDVAMGVSTIVGVAGQTAIQGYTAYQTLELMEEQQELQGDLALKKAGLEEELFASQMRIADIQAEGMQERQEIDIGMLSAQAEALQTNLARTGELAEMQKSLQQQKIQYELQNLGFQSDLAKLQYEQQLKSIKASTPVPVSQQQQPFQEFVAQTQQTMPTTAVAKLSTPAKIMIGIALAWGGRKLLVRK